VGGLQFFAGLVSPQLQTGYDSIFISNIHAANLGARFSIGRRADLFVGYTITKEYGRRRSAAAPAELRGQRHCSIRCRRSADLRVSHGARIVPPHAQAPLERALAILGYNEQFQLFSYYENYHAHTGFTSLLWSF